MDIKQDEQYLGDSVGKDWWKWSVKLAGASDELDKVDYVEYTLHPTFPEPVRYVDERASDFMLEAEGWGGFTIYANVVLKDGTQKELEHHLKLSYPDGQETTN